VETREPIVVFSVAVGGWYTDGLEGYLFFTLLFSRGQVVFNSKVEEKDGGSTV
jgi:hypothetical protein